ncbi:GH25 family lysozyme [Leuconostoc litchii]|uniref:1,4-beta-N-acetylmuramidase n=1 Tax=Leuconostoc litchii TaxID=1981069 RepID=A0A6P2CMY6_9LACO|nr:GH25 family lysozyme [Leuconostoc litchii]TYC47398.1 1,4-beta-N-acetylmuramidase [Leuconostoc litchii]
MENVFTNATQYKTKKLLTFISSLLIILGVVLSFTVWFFAKPVISKSIDIPDGFSVQGVSLNQTSSYIDFDNLANNNINFIYMRTTYGDSSMDSGYKSSLSRAKSAHLKVGTIHVYDASVTAAAQSQYYIDNVGNSIGELPIAISVTSDQISTATSKQRLASLVQTLISHYDHDVIIYTTPAIQKKLSSTIKNTKYWLIEDNTKDTSSKNLFIQYDEDHTIGTGLKAIKMPTTVFNGTQKQFEVYK